MSTRPRIEPTLEPATTPRPDPAGPGAELRPQRSLQPPAHRERSSLLGHLLILLLTLLGLLLLVIVALRWLPPPTTSYMLQSPTKPVQYQWVPASQINDSVRQAVVAAEDQKFWSHHGFDFEAIQKAEEYNRNARHHRRGASTISQQTAKNLFLWPGGWVRKGIEAGLTVLIERLWGKPRILEMYLNVAEFGPGIYGVGAASQAYFGKPAALLTYQDAARLAAVLPNPRQWSVRNPGAYVQARTAWILGQMGQGGAGAPEREPQPTPADLQGADQDEALQPADPDASGTPADSAAPPADPASAPPVEVPGAAPEPPPTPPPATEPAAPQPDSSPAAAPAPADAAPPPPASGTAPPPAPGT